MPLGIVVGPAMYQFMFEHPGEDCALYVGEPNETTGLLAYHGIPVVINPDWPVTQFMVAGFPREMEMLMGYEVPDG